MHINYMLMSSKSVRMDIYELNTESVDGQYQMPVKFIKVNKPELLTVENPNYADLIRDIAHLSEVVINRQRYQESTSCACYLWKWRIRTRQD
jgi:translation initiation factor 2B subunit (eIF-2B alpha/beta/delta family)